MPGKVLLSAALAMSFAASATAASKVYTVPGSALVPVPPAAVAPIPIGVSMASGVNSTFFVNIALPTDFKANSTATLRILLMSDDGGCAVAMKATGIYRMRDGRNVLKLSGAGSGFTISGSATALSPAAGRVFSKDFRLAPATLGPVTTQIAGDVIGAMISRQGASGSDTCAGGLYAQGARLIYTAP
jgi:hypothetical protein